MIGAFVLAVTASAAMPAPKTPPTEFPPCPPYYHQACSEAIGKWLPEMSEWYRWSPSDQQPSNVSFTDAFIYEGHKPKRNTQPYYDWQTESPKDGTFFVYGNAGPPKGSLVYDYANRITYYGQGCCSWFELVAATGVSPPPKRVASRDLATLRTVHGVRLGQTVSEVLALYGPARISRAAGHATIVRVAYAHKFDKDCGQYQTFIFKNGRLIFIGLMNGC